MNRATYSEFQFASQVRDRHSAPSADEGWLGELADRLAMHRAMILVIAAAGVLAGLAYGLARPPGFSATAAIILSPGLETGAAGEGEAGRPPADDRSAVDSEIEVLRSTSVVARVVDKAGVGQAGAWVAQPRAPLLAQALGPAPQKTLTGSDINAVVRDIRAALRLARKGRTRVIEVTATAARPADAANLANAVAQAYLDAKRDERLDASRDANAWLNDRLSALKADAAAKDAEVDAYRDQLDDASIGAGDVAGAQLAAVQKALVDAAASYTEMKARLEQLDRLSAAGANDAVHAALNLSASQDEADAARALAALRSEVEVGRIRVEQLEKAQRELEDRLANISRSEVKLHDLQRQSEAATGVYQQYLLQLQAAGDTSSRKAIDARILSAALQPEHASTAPPWAWPAAFGAAGALLGVFAALARIALNNRLMRPQDVQRKLRKPALASIPLVSESEFRQAAPDERSPEGSVVAKPMSMLAESVRVLLTQTMSIAIEGQGVVIAVTSAVAGEGKTTVAASLGRIAAMGGHRVLMIEGDLRMRSLSRLAIEPAHAAGPDVLAALLAEADWRTAVAGDQATDAHILPATSATPAPGNPFGTARMRRIIAEARAAYELIILDCPAVLAIADARSLAAVADATVVVCNWNATPAPAVRSAIRELESAGGRTIGVVLNRLKPSLARRLAYGAAQ